MRELIVNFGGFYESFNDFIIDNAIEREHEYLQEISPGFDLKELVYSKFDFSPVFLEFSKLYIKYLESGLEITFNLKFLALERPQFYNYSTDKIIAKTDTLSATTLINKTLHSKDSEVLTALEQVLKDKFTDRSGFISYYDNTLEGWQDQTKSAIDCNQLGVLLEFYCNYFLDIELSKFSYENDSLNEDLTNMITEQLYNQLPQLNDIQEA